MVEYNEWQVQLDARIDVLVCAGGSQPGIGADEIHSERPRSQGAQPFYHYDQAICRIGGCSQHAQSARIGDRGRKLLVRDESHPSSDERMSDAEFPSQPGLKGRNIRWRALRASIAVVDIRIIGRVGHGFSFGILKQRNAASNSGLPAR
jgi:hypothetical protein